MAFVKFGSLAQASLVTLADWRRHIVAASIHQDPEQIKTLSEFEIDRDSFIYVRARAVSAGEHYGANDNGDFFPEAELVQYHKTFVRRGVYVNHKSDDPATAIGIIIDAVWHGDKRKYVECLLAIDRAEPIARKIESGIAHSWSMGALVKECECSVCAKRCTSEADYCDCLRTAMGREWNGKKVYAINRGLNFYELSNVTVPADPLAFTLSVVAEKQEGLKKAFTELADAYQAKAASLAEAAAKEAVVGEVRKRIGQHDSAPQSDKQILGTVRHRLKVATAPILPREDKMRQRVKSALEAGSAPDETPKRTIAEKNIPLEGIKVMDNNLVIRYLPGDTLKDCYFIGRRGNLQVVKCASELLDDGAKRRIEAAEKAELIKDDSKPKPDNEWHPGDSGEPQGQVNPLSAKPSKDMKDDSKPTPDSTHNLGKDPIQPSDVVKRYAQLLGAKSVTFKKGENGSFTAILSGGGSVTKLATLWGTAPRLVRQAAVGGKPMEYAREEAKGEGKNPREGGPTFAREDKKKDMAKPAGTGAGAEQKSYYQGFDSKDLSGGGEAAWARKVNELTRVASAKDTEIKALKAENGILRKTIEAQKQAVVEERKAIAVSKIVEYMEKVGAMRPDTHAVLDLKEAGLSHEDAEVKAYADAVAAKKAELKQLDVKALETMLSNLSEMAPAIHATASRKDLELPRPGRDERSLGDEDVLSKAW